MTNRVLFLAALGGREVVTLANLLESDDTVHMRSVLSSFGVEFVEAGGELVVKPPEHLQAGGKEVFIGNAGTVARFMSAASLVVEGSYGLTGVERMHERPQDDLFAALVELGVPLTCGGDGWFFTGAIYWLGWAGDLKSDIALGEGVVPVCECAAVGGAADCGWFDGDDGGAPAFATLRGDDFGDFTTVGCRD